MDFTYAICLLLILICLPLVISLLLKLAQWDNAFKKWENKQIQESLNQTEEDPHDRVPENFLLQNTIISPLVNTDQKLDLYSKIDENTLLIFLDKTCVFCNNNFEEFVHMIKEHSIPKSSVAIFFSHNQLDSATTFNNLYNSEFNIYLLEDDNYKSTIEAPFLPIYTKVDTHFHLTLKTPSPLAAVFSFK